MKLCQIKIKLFIIEQTFHKPAAAKIDAPLSLRYTDEVLAFSSGFQISPPFLKFEATICMSNGL